MMLEAYCVAGQNHADESDTVVTLAVCAHREQQLQE